MLFSRYFIWCWAFIWFGFAFEMRLSISKRTNSLTYGDSVSFTPKFNNDYFHFELNKNNNFSKLEQKFLNRYKGLLRQASHRNQNDSYTSTISSISDSNRPCNSLHYSQSIKLNKDSSRYIDHGMNWNRIDNHKYTSLICLINWDT